MGGIQKHWEKWARESLEYRKQSLLMVGSGGELKSRHCRNTDSEGQGYEVSSRIGMLQRPFILHRDKEFAYITMSMSWDLE